MIRQAIAGAAPAEASETTVMTVWPSNAAHPIGALLGKLYSIKAGYGVVTLGNLIALASIPVALVIFFLRLAPFIGARYRLTNRRVIVERGLTWKEEKSVALDRFDSIDIDIKPGQAWYDAGDLVFKHGEVETFRLAGVSRPHAFQATCVKSQMAFTGIQKALAHDLVSA
jgi:hypothetical protein